MQLHGNAEFAGYDRRKNTDHFPSAAHSHALGQRNLRRHHQGEFYSITQRQRHIAVKRCSSRAEIVGKSAAFDAAARPANPDRHLKAESLPGPPFQTKFACAHVYPYTCNIPASFPNRLTLTQTPTAAK